MLSAAIEMLEAGSWVKEKSASTGISADARSSTVIGGAPQFAQDGSLFWLTGSLSAEWRDGLW